MLGRQLAVATVCSSILSSRAALVPSVTEYAVDGIPGYTTYRLVVELDDTERNCYTLVGAADHRTTIPAAYNVAPPFGVSKGGVNPAYFPYNSEAEYDSWLTVGPNTENTYVGSQMGTVGIDFESWTPDRALEFNNGAIFWMSPNDGASGDVLLAQLTIPTGTIWHATIGKLQGRSFSGGADWNEEDIPFSNAVAVSGCMQSGATNYDPAATVPTECVWPVSGCMQSGATNYDPAATVPTECVWPVSGCMQSGATNFDPDATISDGSCVFDYCASMPCQNGAACFSSAGSYLCQCTSGFVGVDCQVSIDFCASAPCENGGICTSGSGGYQCTCNIGFVGTNCETLEDSSNGCTPPTICPSHLDPVCGSDGVDYGNPCLATCAQPFSEGRCADHEPDPGLGVDPTAPCRRNCDYAHATPTTHEVGVDLVLGYTTLQFGVHLGPQAFNVYAIAGTAENPTYIPPARLDPSFHTDVGGPSTMFWTMFPELQYDSFLTIGCIGSDVCASHGTISHVGIPWQDWSQTTPMVIGELGNELSGGSMFFMNPDDGPEATAGHPEDDTIVLAQLTVPTQTPFTMLVGEIQGRTECPGGCDPGERRPPDWDAFDLQWDSPWGGAPVPGTDIGQVFGCTRSTSVNYNPDATIDDGSCQQCTWDTDMPAVMNTCCGHRRMLSEGVTCEALPDTCPSIDCAELFIGFFESCGSRLQREGLFEQYGFFAANCELLLAESQLPPDAAIGRPFLAIGATSATTSISVLNHGSDWLAEL